MAGTPALLSEQSEGQRLGGGEQLSDELRARFRGAVVSGWRISVDLKNTLLLKNANHHLHLQCVITFLLAEGLDLMLVADQGRGC